MNDKLAEFTARIKQWGGGVLQVPDRNTIVVGWKLGNQVQMDPLVLEMTHLDPETLADMVTKQSLYELKRVLDEKIQDFELRRAATVLNPAVKVEAR